MPNHFKPRDAARSEEVEFALEILGSSSKSQILRFIAQNPDTYFGKIRTAIPGMSQNTLSRHLRALEEAGVVKVDLPPDERRGRTPRYAVDVDAIAAITNHWFDYLSVNLTHTRRSD